MELRLLVSMPKKEPARYGREAFVTSTSVALSERGVLVMRPGALRRLDRVDCVILDQNLLSTDRWSLDQIVVQPKSDAMRLFRRAEKLFHPADPTQRVRRKGWKIGPVGRDETLPAAWQELRMTLRGRRPVVGLWEQEELRALFSTRSITDPESEALITGIREAGLELIIAADDEEEAKVFHPDRIGPMGEDLKRYIRHLQRDFQVVAYLGDGPNPAMDSADVSMGFMNHSWEDPWNADLVAGRELADATFLVRAIREARKVSRNSAALAGAGAGIGAVTALRGLAKTRPGRVMWAVNGASVLGLGYGLWRGRRLQLEERPEPPPHKPWHRMSGDEVLKKLGSSRKGLSQEEVALWRGTPEKVIPRWQNFGEAVITELQNPLTPALAAGAAVSAVVGSVVDAGIVGSVIAFNGLVGGVERHNAERAIAVMARRDLERFETRRRGGPGDGPGG